MAPAIPLKARLARGDVLFGTVVTVPCPTNVEAMVVAGVDWLWLDMEHSPIGLESVQTLMAVTNGSQVVNLVRVQLNDPVQIKRVLDLGPQGVIVPMVNSAAEAAAAVQACLYPPDGIRGVGLARAHGYGATLADYLGRANDEIAVVVQIEHIDAVRAIEDIAATPGVAAALIGPYDLSGSMGLLGQVDHPDVQAAVDRVLSACRRAAMPVGMFVGTKEQAAARAAEGVQLIAINVDANMLRQAYAEALQWTRQAAGKA